jgi:hypothetical protein
MMVQTAGKDILYMPLFFQMTIIILLFAASITLILMGSLGARTLSLSFETRKGRPVDISHLQRPPAIPLRKTVEALIKMGFNRLGEARIKLSSQSFGVWVFASSDKLTYAELVEEAPGLVLFNTTYKGDAFVETGFPVGENIETHCYRSHTITSNIEKAYLHHTRLIKDFSERHGAPSKIETMTNYLDWDSVFRKQYGWQKGFRNACLNAAQILLLGYFIALFSLWVYHADKAYHASIPADPLVSFTFLLESIAPAAVISIILSYLQTWSSKRETKSA